jgi:UMF1 family MFS transporter
MPAYLPTGSRVTESARRGLLAWALYDFANSAFTTVILTFVFAAYFTSQVAPNDITGSAIWGNAIGISGFLVAVIAPFLGAITDQTGRRKPWIALFTGVAVVSTALMWYVAPNADWLVVGAVLAAIGALGFELAFIFYNAMLPDLAGPERTGRWSGWAWALGYAGGLLSLVAVLVLFIEDGTRLPFLSTDDARHVRASFLFVAAWIGLFALPLFLFTPDTPRTGVGIARGVKDGVRQLADSIREVRKYKDIVKFLIARIFYIDGLATVFAFGGVFAAGTFGMGPGEILRFAIALNVSAGLGALLFAWIDDAIGSRQTILISLVGLIAAGSFMLSVTSPDLFFWAGVLFGIFVGPTQAASRSYMARVAPEHLRNQMFGLFAFSGKATAFAGPLLVGWITAISGSQRTGMSILIVLFGIGFLIMLTVPKAKP